MVKKIFQKTFAMLEPDQLDVVVNEFKSQHTAIATTNLVVPYENKVLFVAIVHYEFFK